MDHLWNELLYSLFFFLFSFFFLKSVIYLIDVFNSILFISRSYKHQKFYIIACAFVPSQIQPCAKSKKIEEYKYVDKLSPWVSIKLSKKHYWCMQKVNLSPNLINAVFPRINIFALNLSYFSNLWTLRRGVIRDLC